MQCSVDSVWDIRDKAPVVLPIEYPKGINDPITNQDLSDYRKAYRQMPGNLRARYDRCLCTIDVIVQLIKLRGR